ncbi:outer membrane lipoprotein carrier protein LolA [bacterium]|nr:outer membrane lipoprotein carrier protein LolA [bacterium]
MTKILTKRQEPGTRAIWLPLILLVTILFCHSMVEASKKANPDDIIKRVKKRYQELVTLQANFQQDYLWELAGETQTTQGSLLLKAGNKYRIETENDLIVTNGETVWSYSKVNDQVIIDHLKSTEENPLPKDLLFQFSEEYKPYFIAEEKLEGKKTLNLNLVPKDEEAFVKSMKIWVDADSWLTVKIQQVDINDNVNTYHVRDVQQNIELQDSLFNFQIPAEAEVVDLR